MERNEIEGDFVLDSSVIIKWFSQEENTDIAITFRESHLNGKANIASPDLLIYEIANALRYNKSLSKNDVENAVTSVIDIGMSIIVPTKSVTAAAISFAFDYNISLYDAYFIALAKSLKFVFVTADEKLYLKVKGLGFIGLLKSYSVAEDS